MTSTTVCVELQRKYLTNPFLLDAVSTNNSSNEPFTYIITLKGY